MPTDIDIDIETLSHNYVALWMEPDPATRRTMISELWANDGAHVLLDPPAAISAASAAIGFPSPSLEVRGAAGLERRVSQTYEELIAPGQFQFRARDHATRLNNVVTFNWEMVATGGGEVVGVGLDVLVLDATGRIRFDYQLIEA